MAGGAPDVGTVLRYWYLWRDEFEAGEDAGRKPRPSVVVVAIERTPLVTRIAVAPITHTAPEQGRLALELSPTVKAHLGLDAQPSWVICDELNEFNWPGYDLESRGAQGFVLGRLPHGVAQRVRALAAEAMRRGRLKSTKRD